ncbi:xylulokinase [Marinibacterium profundimaris]|uniref:Xylulose kinase n=1 Tax=Marinibacterium profundimaris TaxID=1679460 RepID=A0A225NHP8_9RHOB|nr:xylulokinase [Marinibacterium profundimaris]OWU72962.1 xylulose kinase [Marinibacterium profundimaris]
MFIGLDLGTSGLRALLVTETGDVVGQAEAAYPAEHPHPGWSEQDPADWIRALGTVLTELRAAHPEAMAAVKGLATSGHMHGAVTLDAGGAVLRPAILWNDTRSHAEAAELDATPGVRDLSGNIVFPGFTAPKLVWMARNEPELFARVATAMLPKDYLNLWLTGRATSEMSDAAGTSWLDVGARAWSDELLAASGMRADQMPELLEGSDVVGPVLPERAAELGLPEGCLVVAGGADNAVAACGIGALGEGQGFVSLGTSGVLLAGRDGFAPRAESAVHTFCHAIPGAWYQMGVVLAATDSLNWLGRITGESPAALTGALGDDLQGPGPVRFLPYLSGERTPHNDSVLRGAFLNLDIATDRTAMAKAVMEGVSFALRDCLDALKGTGARLDRVIAIGGGARSLYWCKLLATVLDLPVDRPEAGEFGAALGAARLAICGVTGADPSAVMTPPAIAETIDPDPTLVPAFAEAQARFRGSYPQVKELQ